MKHYKDIYLFNHKGIQFAGNSYKKTDYGYSIRATTNFVSITQTKLYIYGDGTAKAVSKVNRNYAAKYQYTTYFDSSGIEIIAEGDNTRKELALWKKHKKELIQA